MSLSTYYQSLRLINQFEKKERLMLPYHKYKTIDDIYGEKHYIKESFFEKKFDVEIYLGRPVANIMGRNKFIITSELEEFILSTLSVPSKEFSETLKKSAVINLRRILRDNPFSTYVRWQKSTHKNRPKFITFNNVRSNPELIKDFFGNNFVVLSALRTDEGLFFPMGVPEEKYFDTKSKNTKKYILTSEIAQILKENRFYPHRVLKSFPFNDQTLASLRSELGYNLYTDRNAWLALHAEEILNSTAKDFCLKYNDAKIKQPVIATIKTQAKLIYTILEKETNSVLANNLEKNWKTPSDEIRKEINAMLGVSKSIKMRRTFSILKEAGLI